MINRYLINVRSDGKVNIDLDEDDTDWLGWQMGLSFDEAIQVIRRHWYAETRGIDPPPLS